MVYKYVPKKFSGFLSPRSSRVPYRYRPNSEWAYGVSTEQKFPVSALTGYFLNDLSCRFIRRMDGPDVCISIWLPNAACSALCIPLPFLGAHASELKNLATPSGNRPFPFLLNFCFIT